MKHLLISMIGLMLVFLQHPVLHRQKIQLQNNQNKVMHW